MGHRTTESTRAIVRLTRGRPLAGRSGEGNLLSLACALACVLGPAPGSAQLVSYWSLDHTLKDAAERGARQDLGEMVGRESYVPGRLGACLDLDGSSHVVFPASPDTALVGDLSVALWFRVASWDTPDQCLIAGGLGRRLSLQRFRRSDRLVFRSGSAAISGGEVNDGKWHHVLATSQRDWGTRLFIDGKQVAVGDKPALIASESLHLGGNPAKAGLEWRGQIDDVGVFQRSLNEYEAAALVELALDPNFAYTLGQVNALFEAHARRASVVIGAKAWRFVPRADLAGGAAVRLAGNRSGMEVRLTPHIQALTASNEIPALGESVTLAWEVANAESLTLYPTGADLSARSARGSLTVSPDKVTTYTLMASNSHGADLAQITLHAGVEVPLLQMTEWMADPAGEIRGDGAGAENSDWIELYNPGPIEVPTSGYHLTDDPDRPKKWPLPDGHLAPRAYRIVQASGRRLTSPETAWHANFKLSRDGEYLALSLADSSGAVRICDAVEYPAQRRGVAYGKAGASAAFGYLSQPTPGEANVGEPLTGFARGVELSHTRGFYEEPFELTLNTGTPGGRIRFTRDGSRPTAESGILYDGPVTISTTSTIRAVAYTERTVPSAVATHTYLFAGQMAQQGARPSGWPDSWLGIAADYEMDPDIVRAPRFAEKIAESLVSIPLISLSLDPEALLGPDGIYTNPLESGVVWERPASMEWVSPQGAPFQIDCGLRMQGGYGRNPQFLKHSFRLLFKRDYGPSRLKKRLFADTQAVGNFDTLILRAGFNNTWHRGEPEEAGRAQYLRDEFMRRSQLAMGHASPRGAFVHLVINGLYWGVYNLVERPNAAFAASYLGGKKQEWDALNSGKSIDGNLDAWTFAHQLLAARGAAEREDYESVREWFDLTNLIDYLILNFYGGNLDWDHHNWYAARRRSPGEGFQFFSWDAERSLEDLRLDRIESRQGTGQVPTGVHTRLLANADYRMAFADRIHKHFTGEGALTARQTVERYRRLADSLEPAILCESARWGDVSVEEPYTIEDWRSERDRLITNFFPRRSDIVWRQFIRRGLYPSVRPPSLQPHGGEAQIVVLQAEEEGIEIWSTTDGSDPRLPGGQRNPAAQSTASVTVAPDQTLKARTRKGKTWSALVEARYNGLNNE